MTQITAEMIRGLIEAERDASRKRVAFLATHGNANAYAQAASNEMAAVTSLNSALDALAQQEKERAEGLSDAAILKIFDDLSESPDDETFEVDHVGALVIANTIIARVAPSTSTDEVP